MPWMVSEPHHRPLKAGLRLSANARRASTRSSVFKTRSYAAFSETSPFCHPLTACMAAFNATGPPSQISLASCRLASRTFSRALPSCFSSSGVTSTRRSHSPRKYASAPVTLRPVNIRSRARLAPIRAGSRKVPPAPGMMASLVSGSPTMDVEPKTRSVVQSPSSSPPPRAVDEMAEIVGMGRLASSVKVDRRLSKKALTLSSLASADLHYGELTLAATCHAAPSSLRLRRKLYRRCWLR